MPPLPIKVKLGVDKAEVGMDVERMHKQARSRLGLSGNYLNVVRLGQTRSSIQGIEVTRAVVLMR